MFTKIMVPVDLAHAATVEKAIQIAADLAKLHNAEIFLVGVTDTAPGSVAHDPAEYQQKLEQFAADHSSRHGCSMAAKVVICNDPAAELDEALEDYGKEINVDLVVMASHLPGFMDHLFHSRAGHLATHTDISVFIVR
jgi:nucleotide-binding universal stress UspA family protein